MRNQVIVFAALAAAAVSAGSASAASNMSDRDFLQVARCRGLAASEGLGKMDTGAIDAVIREEIASRSIAVRKTAQRKLTGAKAEADAAAGVERDALIAERSDACGAWLGEARQTIASTGAQAAN